LRGFFVGSLSPRIFAARAFTLIELVVVIAILGIVMTVVGLRLGVFSFWNEETFIRRLSETIVFLHHQAVADQSFYQLEFDFEKNTYRIGVLRSDADVNADLTDIGEDAGAITLELAAYLNPSVGKEFTLIPPPGFPSLAEPFKFPEGMFIERLRTVRGITEREKGAVDYIRFSPRGLSEFAVIHLGLRDTAQRTILVNPFTGNTEIFNGLKDFEWTYGRTKEKGRG
jgi:prepilin-type N-terminal cleavage/methylation domain-containing protein